MSGELKVIIKGKDRQILIALVKQERRNLGKSEVAFNAAEKRAVEFYQDHLKKVHRKLDPNSVYLNLY